MINIYNNIYLLFLIGGNNNTSTSFRRPTMSADYLIDDEQDDDPRTIGKGRGMNGNKEEEEYEDTNILALKKTNKQKINIPTNKKHPKIKESYYEPEEDNDYEDDDEDEVIYYMNELIDIILLVNTIIK